MFELALLEHTLFENAPFEDTLFEQEVAEMDSWRRKERRPRFPVRGLSSLRSLTVRNFITLH